MRVLKIVLLLAAALVPLAGVYVLNNATLVAEWLTDTGGFHTGETLPSVTGEEVDGGTIDTARYRGMKFVAMIAKIDCESCKSSYPVLQKWSELYPETPLVMIGVGGKEAYGEVKRDLQFSFPLLAADRTAQDRLRIKITPVFYAMDEQGTIIERMNGYRVKDFQKFMKRVGEA
ncbi:TlpA family protein disulfide reductase [Paenibacillus oceani]|uniref:Redoxin domain-containing protein n=1 Tax=Paenibacillus oceani TaxID=2772510 RepID=A0A927H2A7_9BACL|nr:redoxin domain-containing protein [Paenibacillus oceani]MBD2865067.1 redoxin domain-containing protein [Paenibacillus oceani]